MNKARTVLKYFTAIEQSEGVGAKVRRSIGTLKLRHFAPFLLLDHFTVAPPAGFPDHPHHGQETITYVLGGMIAHEDFTGSQGVLREGDLQFMTAGKGIVHSEIPVQLESNEPAAGLQLWVDLPEKLKNCEPRYRDLRKKETPIAKPHDCLEVRVISGKSYGVESLSELAYTPVDFYHFINSKKGVHFKQEFPADFNVFMYVLKGAVTVNSQLFPQFSSVFFKPDGLYVEGVSASEDAEFVLVGGQILDQPVVQHGPFVETTRERIIEVFDNYRSGTNGFERAPGWSSSIFDGIKQGQLKAFEKSSL
ncbi:LAME_0D10572g1_1 [Lachancea meyersii CBS 8951]|uniref:LAME_0D10572g1_1 n=1 Tax=Lachancea meyersii CBS 8951 TaxID=1266667 RepID=A0A1G4JBV2_9SACH|nr:LAME_0D10572g1_1 [Lachancea meyersii CBS 8951]